MTRTGDTLSSMWFGGALLGTEEGGGGGVVGSYMQHWTTSVATIQVKMSLIDATSGDQVTLVATAHAVQDEMPLISLGVPCWALRRIVVMVDSGDGG